MSFFASRWVDRPGHVSELAPTALPEGFVAGGVAAGIKPEGEDVGLLFSEREATTSAARFTTNALVAAPVTVARDEADLSALRAVTVNSGNANVSDGERGLETARAQQRAAAEALDLDPKAVAVASTGVIARELPRAKAVAGIRQAAEALAPNAQAFSDAILTTDNGPKRACLELALPSGGVVRLAGQAKGGGMISPHFATMLCFVQTDAALAAETVELLTGVCVKRSFDRISVDGQLSTNDAVFVQANGASGVQVEPESPDELAMGEALDALLRQLALEMVADGEGASRVGRVVVRGDVGHGRAGGQGGGQLAAGQDGAGRRRPQLRPHPPGRGAGPGGARAVRHRPGRGRPAGGHGRRHGRAGLPGRVGADRGLVRRGRGRVRAARARRGRRGRGVLQRPDPRVRDHQRGLHDLMEDAREPVEYAERPG